MSCTVKTKILDKLKEEKVISDTREILDFREFDRLNALYTKHAIEKYDLPTNGKLLIDVASNTIKLGKGNRIRPVHERTIYRAVPNDKLMGLLDDIIVDYKENTNFESKDFRPGVSELFESNPELANQVYEAVGITKETTQTPKGVVQDLSGNTYSVNEPDIITYETEFGPIRYIIDENGDMVMLSDKNTGTVEDQIPPQQKQQAQQLYAQYLEQNPNGSVEGFKDFVNNNFESKDVENTIQSLLDKNKKDILFSEDKTQIDNDNTNSQTENLNNFILFNNQDGKFTAKDVLNNIKVNFDGFTQSSQDIINKLIPLLERTNATIKFVSNSALKHEDTLMEYNPKSNEIRISRDKLNDISEEYAVRTFLHEVVHSITVDAYARPESIEAQMFRDFIDSMYNKYKELSGYKEGDVLTNRNYGFTNQIEFIAEIMTNPKFQAEIKELEGNKSWWDKLVDYIRTLVGLRKTSDYNNAIDYITNISLQSDYQGGLSLSNAIFEKKKTEEEDDINDKRYIKLRTIEDRLTFTLDRIKDNLDQNIANYEHLIKITKDTEKIEHYKGKLEELLESLESLDKTEEWKGISQYTTQLLENIGQLERRFRSEDLSVEEADKTIHLYNKYLQSNSLIEPVQRLISDARREKDLPITQTEIEDIQKALDEASSKYTKIKSSIDSFNRSAAVNLLNDRLYAPEVLFKWREKLKKEHKQLGINENVTSWVSRQMNTTYKDEVDADVLENAEAIVQDPSFDISTGSKLFDAALNTNNELIQVTQSIIDKMRNKILEEKLELSLELQKLFEEFTNEQGNSSPSTLYKNMYEYDSEGNIFLKGEYSVKFKEEYDKELAKYRDELAEVKKGTAEYKDFYNKSKFKKWKDANLKEITEDGKKRIIPVDKWKTDLSGMSEVEVKVLKKAREVFEKSNYQTYKIKSLISDPFYGVKTYSLPSITAGTLENTLEGKGKELVKDKIKDLTSVRLDDVGYEEATTDITGNPIRNVKVHFRGKPDRGQQSLDLFTMMALEGYNGINFRNKQETESNIQMILDIAKDKTYYRRKGLNTQMLSRNKSRNRAVTKKGEESNVYKRLESLMEINIYDILHKDVGKLGPIDINKAVGMANGYTALIGLTLNEISAVANVTNGKAQMFLEGIAGNYMSFGAIAKAEAKYFSHLPEMFKDINKPVSTSYINQLTDMYDTYGTISVSMQQAFIKNGILKSNLNLKSLQFMQESGEHWMQSVLTMAVLEDIKVMDKDSNFIDKDGNIVKDKKKAASLLDMTKMVDGKLTTDSKVVYTTRTVGVEFNKGGKEMITKLIKKKIFDTNGNYDSNMQPEAMRHFQFKLVMMYRKYLVPLGLARYRGFIHINKKLPDLEKHEVFFSHALQDYETGIHTETARFIFTGIRDMFEEKKFSVLKTNWNELTTTQKKQIHKSIMDLAFMFALLPALTMLLGAMGGDDDDDGALAFMMLQSVRLQSELRSYMSINDQWRLIQSPIPALRVLESSTDLISRFLQPWDWGEEIKGGKHKGDLRIFKNAKNLIPVLTRDGRTYKDTRKYIENQAL